MKYFSNYLNDYTSVIFAETGAFFAFSEKQFNDRKQEGVKYAHCGSSLFCPVENAKSLGQRLSEASRLARAKDVEENGVAGIIQRQYFNYESQISMDTDDAKESLRPYQDQFPYLFTEAVIKEGFDRCWRLAIDNDWF